MQGCPAAMGGKAVQISYTHSDSNLRTTTTNTTTKLRLHTLLPLQSLEVRNP